MPMPTTRAFQFTTCCRIDHRSGRVISEEAFESE